MAAHWRVPCLLQGSRWYWPLSETGYWTKADCWSGPLCLCFFNLISSNLILMHFSCVSQKLKGIYIKSFLTNSLIPIESGLLVWDTLPPYQSMKSSPQTVKSSTAGMTFSPRTNSCLLQGSIANTLILEETLLWVGGHKGLVCPGNMQGDTQTSFRVKMSHLWWALGGHCWL